MLVQDAPLRAHYVLIPAQLTVSVSLETLDAKVLPSQWRTHAGRDSLQALGGSGFLLVNRRRLRRTCG